jgi:hypothetical protein
MKALQCCKTSGTAWPSDTELHPRGLLIMSFTFTFIQIQCVEYGGTGPSYFKFFVILIGNDVF